MKLAISCLLKFSFSLERQSSTWAQEYFGSPEVRITKCHFDYSLRNSL